MDPLSTLMSLYASLQYDQHLIRVHKRIKGDYHYRRSIAANFARTEGDGFLEVKRTIQQVPFISDTHKIIYSREIRSLGYHNDLSS